MDTERSACLQFNQVIQDAFLVLPWRRNESCSEIAGGETVITLNSENPIRPLGKFQLKIPELIKVNQPRAINYYFFCVWSVVTGVEEEFWADVIDSQSELSSQSEAEFLLKGLLLVEAESYPENRNPVGDFIRLVNQNLLSSSSK